MAKDTMGDVVVLIPGITGSVLEKDGEDLWAISSGAVTRALLSLGRNIDSLKLADDPPDVDDLGDGVVASRIMPDVHLIPGLWKIDGYSKVAGTIKARFEVEQGKNYFEFPYDWRRDNSVAARRLARESYSWLKAWRDSQNTDAKLILIGHSMGGLVARYFLECLDGWETARALVTFGTPFDGALNALDVLANGLSMRLGSVSVFDMSNLVRSFMSVYQLLPTYECYDAGDGQFSTIAKAAGIPNVDSGKAKAAAKFHDKIGAAVDEHLKTDRYRDIRYLIQPIVGIFQPTLQAARLVGNKLVFSRDLRGRDEGGDGTVPRRSATPIELRKQGREMYVAARHASIQNGKAALDQLVGVLSGLSLDDLTDRRGVPGVQLAIDIDDAYSSEEPVRIQARSNSEVVQLRAAVVDVETGIARAEEALVGGDADWHQVTLAPLPVGTYRVIISDQAEGGLYAPPASVSDLFVVFEAGA